MKWAVMLMEGNSLYAVFGPFDSRQLAEAWVSTDPDEKDLERRIVQLHKP